MRYLPGEPHRLPISRALLAAYKSVHFKYEVHD